MFFVSSGWLSCCDLRKKLLVLNHHRSRTTSPSHQSVFYSQMEGSGSRGGRSHESLLPNYKLGKTLGIGAFGKVKLAVHTLTGHEVAVKILNRQMINTAETEERVRREIKLLSLFTHPHIIRLYEVIEMRSNIYVVTEYVKSGELFYYIMERGRLQEDEARRFFQQIISGVECCHMNMVAHRDLKPENLLLDAKCNIKIADFGLSNIIRDGHFLKTACGSPNYAAPEVISGKLYSGPEVDIWSCGVILYALLCGTLPFDDDSLPNLFKKIKGGIYTLPSHLSAGARDLIPRILVVDPTKRITIPEIHRHPWFQAHLPYYIAVPAIVEVQKVKKIDEEIVREMTKMGFDWNIIVESFQNRLQNEATVTYHLLSDARFQFAGGYLGAEFQESSEYGFSPTHTYSASSSTSHSPPTYMDQVSGSRPQDPAERKWSLGLQSQARPSEIMTEVLKALQELDVCWKKIGHYNMKCKWLPNFPGNPETTVSIPNHMSNVLGKEYPTVDNGVGIRSNDVVKFEMQLYKTREAKYLLDLQKVNGSSSLFLNICDAFLTQLQVM